MKLLEEQGYIKLKLTPIQIQERQQFLQSAQKFFSLPIDIKRSIVNKENLIGFREPGIEYAVTPDRPDLMQAFSVSLKSPQALAGILMPEMAKQFDQHMLAMAKSMESVLREVLDSIAVYYQTPWLRTQTSGCEQNSFFQCNYYQPRYETRDLLQDGHDDGTLLTLLYANAPGLEVTLNPEENNYQSIETEEDELLIFSGGLLTYLTEGRIKPLYHRVKNRAEIPERFSYMYFVNPHDIQQWSSWYYGDTDKASQLIQQAKSYSQHFGLPSL